LVSDLRSHGFHVTGDLSSLTWTKEHGQEARPTRPRVVFWPSFPDSLSVEQRLALQGKAMSEGLNWGDRTEDWTVLIDETMWMSEQLRLDKAMNALWFQGRTQRISVVALVQRPARVPKLAFSSTDYLFLAKTGDKADIERYRDINTAVPRELID